MLQPGQEPGRIDQNRARRHVPSIWRRVGPRGVARPGLRVNRAAPGLRPEAGLAPLGGAWFEAREAEPWLAIEPGGPSPAGRWARLVYRLDPLSDPVRPLLRLDLAAGGRRHVILPGPVNGAAVWVGRLPDDVVRLAISPARGPGRFAFALDAFEILPRWRVAAGALRRRPLVALDAIRLRIDGKRVRARHFLTMIWNSTPFGQAAAWAGARQGALAPPPGGPPLPTFGIWVDGGDGAAFARTRDSLAAAGAPVRIWRTGEPGEIEACDWVAVLRAGDALAPGALACVAAAAARDPAATLIHGDDDVPDRRGGRTPVFRPDWSPRLHENARYLDGASFVKREVAGEVMATSCDVARDLVDCALATSDLAVAHVRRVLVRRAASPPVPAVPRTARTATPTVSVVIPNRDSLRLLRACLDGLATLTDYPRLEIVVVDNGSQDPETLALYASLKGDPGVILLDRPGPFNFSALTNAGVAASSGELLLLLNNDISMIEPDWLSRLVDEAVRPGVGAVGATLLYPDGRIQHAGVVIGLGGEAGHPYRGRPHGAPDRMGRPPVPHEVSAVTGACLLVSRAAYESVGGLDERRFPVSFNDIDLCLKLRRRGLRNIQVPGAVLHHHESASRGRDVGEKQARADREARAFAEEWLPTMRDDPYFHPALSLLRFDVSLG